MQVCRQSYRQWPEAWRCATGRCELIVVTSIGPRILSLRFDGGPNLLAEDQTGFAVGDWRLYGGHRFTIAPEASASYVPDNNPCAVEPGDGELAIRTQSTAAGPAKELVIQAEADGAGFAISHRLANDSATLWAGAPWAITCVTPAGVMVMPWSPDTPTGPTSPLRFWHPDSTTHAGPESGQWQPRGDHFIVRPNGRIGKVGLYSARGWLAWLRPDCTFSIGCPQVAPPAAYPDEGCNVEVYTAPAYLELERLGPMVTLALGESVVLEEHWRLTERVFQPRQWREIEDVCRLVPNSLPPCVPSPSAL